MVTGLESLQQSANRVDPYTINRYKMKTDFACHPTEHTVNESKDNNERQYIAQT
jgi:hypothetical protein